MLAGFRWILGERLAGSGRPGLLGTFDEDVAFLRNLRIGLVVTLTEEPGVPLEGMEAFHFPIDDMGIPTPRLCETVCRRIVAEMEADTRVLIHCRAGLGRTGLVAACILVTLGRSAETALDEVRRVNPGYIQTTAQERFVKHYEQHLRSQALAPAASEGPAVPVAAVWPAPQQRRVEVDTVCNACSARLCAGETFWLMHDKAVCGGCAGMQATA